MNTCGAGFNAARDKAQCLLRAVASECPDMSAVAAAAEPEAVSDLILRVLRKTT
jgi:hypothetical protein